MRKKFLTNLALLLFLNLLIKPFWIFGIDRTVQNLVGALDYGFYFSVFNFAFLFSMLLDLGITNFNNRNIAQHHHLLNKYLSGILILKVLLLVAYTSFTFLAAWIIGYDAAQFRILGWIAFNNFLLSFILYLRSNISGLLLLATDSFFSVLDRVLMIIICSVLIWGHLFDGPFRIEWFVYAQTVAYSITFLIILGVVISKAGLKKLTWNRPFFILILKQSYPFAVLILLMTVYNRTDSVFIERLLDGDKGFEQSGIYAMAYRLLDAANQFAMLFAVLLLPIFSRMIKLGQRLDQMVRLPFDILISFAIILSVGSYFYRIELMELLYSMHPDETLIQYSERIQEAGSIYGIIMFGFIGTCLMYIFSTVLTANGNLLQLNIIAGIGIIINFILNIILVPVLEAKGAAIACLSTQVYAGVAYAIVTQYYFKFRKNLRYILSLVAYVVGVAAIAWLSTILPVPWISALIIMSVGSIVLALGLKMINLAGFIKILKTREEVS